MAPQTNRLLSPDFIVRLKFQKRSVLKFASRSESQISEVQRTDICWTTYPIVNKLLGTIPP